MLNMHLFSQMNLPMLLTPPGAGEFVALIPGAIIALVALMFIIVEVFHRPGTSRDYLAYFAAIGLGTSAISTWFLWDDVVSRPLFFGMLYFDKFTLFFAALASVAGAICLLVSPAFLRSHRMDRGEYYLLVMFSVVGMVFMAGAADLLSLFIAFEVMSIPIYVLAAFLRMESRGAEASMKYFVLGAFSATIMLYGIALIYGATGTTNLEMIAENLSYLSSEEGMHQGYFLALAGSVMILSGFVFKVAAVPFHQWAPDVYTGSPTSVVGFMASAVKAIAFAGMLRVFAVAFPLEELRGGFFGYGWIDVAFFVAAASMILGNLVALAQNNLKRMLAYSSIAHAGYILVGFVAANSKPEFFLYNDGILFYLVAYTFGTLGAFGILSYFGRRGESIETYDDIAGLGFKYPAMGLAMGICIFSAAGVPPTAGFLGKLYIFRSAVDVGLQTGEMSLIGLVVLAMLASAAGVYYYLKVLVFMYMKPSTRVFRPLELPAAKLAIVICAVLTIYLGLFPGKLMEISRESVMDFAGMPAEVQNIIEMERFRSPKQ